MNKKMFLISSLLCLGLLSACGNANSHMAGGHSMHGMHQTSGSYKASFVFASGTVKANENEDLSIQITDNDGNPVQHFQVNHEKLLHLIVVNRDLTYFDHLHPEFVGNGKFTIQPSFPSGGDYKMIADFVPEGGSGATVSEWVNVVGEAGTKKAITADSKLVKVVNGKEVELALSSTKPNEDVTLTYTILDAQTKKGINDLEPYLGAVGHVVILSADAEQYIHVHPTNEKGKGPKAQFVTTFPKSGIYKIWAQFQHNGKVFTVPFVVDVQS